jgi:hypothetical protein
VFGFIDDFFGLYQMFDKRDVSVIQKDALYDAVAREEFEQGFYGGGANVGSNETIESGYFVNWGMKSVDDGDRHDTE